MKKTIYLGIFLFFVSLFSIPISFSSNYTIDGNVVYVNDSNVFMQTEPHTIHSSDWVYFNFTSKVYTGNVDMLWGFDTDVTRPKKAEFYNPRTVKWNTTDSQMVYNVSSFVDGTGECFLGNDYNQFKKNVTYTDYSDGWVEVSRILCFDSYDSLPDNDYNITWYTEHSQDRIWQDISDRFDSINYNYQNFDKWYYVTDVSIQQDTNYYMRAYLDVPISLGDNSGKYWVGIKPSSETLSEAISNGHFYYIDPFWNQSWDYKKQVNFTEQSGSNIQDYPIEFWFNHEGNAKADCSDIRVVNETSSSVVTYGQKDCNSTHVQLVTRLNMSSSSTVDDIYVYYGNSEANFGNSSYNEVLYNVWDDFDDGVVDSGWSTEAVDSRSYYDCSKLNESDGVLYFPEQAEDCGLYWNDSSANFTSEKIVWKAKQTEGEGANGAVGSVVYRGQYFPFQFLRVGYNGDLFSSHANPQQDKIETRFYRNKSMEIINTVNETYDTGTYYSFELYDYPNSTIAIYDTTESKVHKTSFTNSTYSWGYVGFTGYGRGNPEYEYFGARHFVNPEPSYTVGSEESQYYISVTFNYSSVGFGSMYQGTSDNEPTQNMSAGLYNVTIDTNNLYELLANATDFDEGNYTFSSSNLKFGMNETASNLSVSDTIQLSDTPATVETNITNSTTVNFHGFWLTIPSYQYASSYSSTLTMTYQNV